MKRMIRNTEMPAVRGAIEPLLRKRIGLDAASIGFSAMAAAVQKCMEDRGIDDIMRYAALLQSSEEAFEDLLESVIVPETWFFRDRQPYEFLKNTARSRPPERKHILRILSLPCSSGEEPYSIAMALLDAGLSHKEFRIDGMDVSGRALARAERGIYGNNSFRGPDLLFRNRYFENTPEGYRLNPLLRNTVRFMRGNLLNHPVAPSSYSIVFCRNLLIYLDPSARKKAIQTLASILEPEGLLFVGHAETGIGLSPLFRTERPLKAFALKKVV